MNFKQNFDINLKKQIEVKIYMQFTKHNTSDITFYVFKKCKTYSALGYL